MTDETKFLRLVFGSGCWEWPNYKIPTGYGRLMWRGSVQQAHRVAYELFVGPIPEGHHVHHACGNRGCVNPEHLETMAQSDHSTIHASEHRLRVGGTCKNGHDLDDATLVVRSDSNGRERLRCIECERAAWRRRDAKRRAA